MPHLCRKIVDSCELKRTDCVLEIGSGRGEITSLIAGKVSRLWAVEVDKRLCLDLQGSLGAASGVAILNRNILSLDLSELLGDCCAKLKVIGNLPYYLSTRIIEYLIANRARISSVYVMLQKEFARRVTACAGSKEFGSLSCFVRYYAWPRILFYIPRTAFYPQPKVDSAFLKLDFSERTLLPEHSREEILFFKLIRSAFNQRRKTLRNSLKGVVAEELLYDFLEDKGLERNVRPEQVSVDNFALLARRITGK